MGNIILSDDEIDLQSDNLIDTICDICDGKNEKAINDALLSVFNIHLKMS